MFKFRSHLLKDSHDYAIKFNSLDKAMNHIMSEIFKFYGNGDMENGGEGSLWRCAREIYDTLKAGNHYFYDDCKWWIEKFSVPLFEVKDILMKKDSLDTIAIHEIDSEYYYFDDMKSGDSNFLPFEEVERDFKKVGVATCDMIEFSKQKFETF